MKKPQRKKRQPWIRLQRLELAHSAALGDLLDLMLPHIYRRRGLSARVGTVLGKIQGLTASIAIEKYQQAMAKLAKNQVGG